jgi:hypothetical protein
MSSIIVFLATESHYYIAIVAFTQLIKISKIMYADCKSIIKKSNKYGFIN